VGVGGGWGWGWGRGQPEDVLERPNLELADVLELP
jgi:hypothetical protein